RRRIFHDVVRDAAVIHHILALLHRHRRHRRHRLDASDVDLLELLDERQHGVELAFEVLDLLIGDRDPRQMRDAADCGGVDGHASLKSWFGPPNTRGTAHAPTTSERQIALGYYSQPG